MSWATNAIKQLQEGKSVQIRPRGNSMRGRIESGALVTIEPVTAPISVGDIVLARVHGNDYLHLVQAIDSLGRYQIANNSGFVNGWTKTIFGKVTRIEA